MKISWAWRAEQGRIGNESDIMLETLPPAEAREMQADRARLPRITDDIEKTQLLLDHVNARIAKLKADAVVRTEANRSRRAHMALVYATLS
jgi:hypothetical protein